MDSEFRTKLREALEDIDKRLRVLEHLTNDVIIGSLEQASAEYKDAADFDAFKTNYGEKLAGLINPYKALFGEDYDLERSLFDDLKATEGYGSEGFDEAGCMDARIADLQARIDALRAEKAEEKAEEKDGDPLDKDEPEELTEEQLAKEFEEAMKAGASE